LRLLVPYFLEIPAAALVLRFGAPMQLVYLMFGMVVLIVPNHLLAVLAAQRQARRYELGGAQSTASSVVLPLETRRLRDYTRMSLEIGLAAANLAGLALLYRQYAAGPERESFAAAYGVPVLLLYLQAGALLIKRALVGWRTVLPVDHTAAYAQWREQARRLFIDTCDAVRILLAGELLLAAISTYAGGIEMLLAASVIAMVAWLVWYTRRRNALLALTRSVQPARLPSRLEPGEHPRGVLCYQPAYPAMLVKGPQGYSLNLASRRAQAGLAYLAGLAGLCFWMSR